jgi:hypothetical protein
MPKKISWKKGMRLTDEVLRAADACTAEYISQAMALAAGGRFGLFPSSRPFQVQMSIAKGFVDVEALACLAITRGGYVIDAQFDTKFTNTLDGRVQIPNTDEEKEYLLTINARPGDWKDNGDGYMEPDYTFALINSQTALPDYAMPIARIVYDDGWREDSADFVPPCLYLSSHPKFEELHQQFVELLHGIDEHTRQQLDTAATTAISIYWPVVKQMLIAANTEHDTMAPQQLLAAVQKVVATFAVACDLDDLLTLEDGTAFHNYAAAPYSYSQAYQRIKQGLGLCYAIGEKIEKFSLLKREKPQPEPVRMPEPPKPTPAPDPRRIWDGKRI